MLPRAQFESSTLKLLFFHHHRVNRRTGKLFILLETNKMTEVDLLILLVVVVLYSDFYQTHNLFIFVVEFDNLYLEKEK